MNWEVRQGDCLDVLRALPSESVHCCVTSPPYWGLRDYGVDGQIGLESTPEQYVARMVDVFREVRRVLRDDGTLWLNLGDSYKNGKQLVGIPWRVAFALQADGWYLRQDIIWHKPNPMPESVRDRCTKAHEYVFLMAKSERYHYDAKEVAEPSAEPWRAGKIEKCFGPSNPIGTLRNDTGRHVTRTDTRNRRSVWTVTPKPFKGAHFAVMPPDLVEPCIKAGCPKNGTVLDPFNGAGTTGLVAVNLGRNYIGIELNPQYADMARARIAEAERRHSESLVSA